MPTTVAARLCRPLLALGEPARAVLERHNLVAGDLDEPEGRVDYDVMVELIELAGQNAGSARIGLYGALSDESTLQVLQYLSRTSLTGYEALEKLVRYQSLLHDACRLSVERGADVIVRVNCQEGLRYPPAIAEFFMASLLLSLKKFDIPLHGVNAFFSHPSPAGMADGEVIPGVPVHFDAGDNYVRLSSAGLDKKLPGSDPALSAVLERHAEALLARVPHAHAFSERVRARLVEELRGGDPSVTRVARLLKLSTRTLRRRLEGEGTTFRAVLDDLRRSLALSYLEEPALGADQTAFLLGFSEASAFRRALKRWTGRSVAELSSQRPGRPSSMVVAVAPGSGELALGTGNYGRVVEAACVRAAEGPSGTETLRAEHDLTYAWDYACQRPELRVLYERGKDAGWNARTDIAWDTSVDPTAPHSPDHQNPLYGTRLWAKLDPERDLPELRRQQMANVLSNFLHGEQASLLATSQLVALAPTADAKLYAASQVSDEARHMEVFDRYLREKVGIVYPVSGPQKELMDIILGDGRWDFKFLGMQIITEGLVLGALGMLEQGTDEPLLRQIAGYVARDERRHVAFGVLSLQDNYRNMSVRELRDREDFVILAANLLHERLLGEDVWDRMGFARRDCEEAARRSFPMQVFRKLCFSKIVPNLGRVGLLTRPVREAFEKLDIIQYDTLEASA